MMIIMRTMFVMMKMRRMMMMMTMMMMTIVIIKMTVPAKMDVQEFTVHTIRAS